MKNRPDEKFLPCRTADILVGSNMMTGEDVGGTSKNQEGVSHVLAART